MIDSTKYYKLEKENKELKKEIEILRSGNDITKIINDNVVFLKYQKEQQEMIKSLKQRNEKAIEYINENWGHWCSDHCKYATETINILRGDDKE